MKNHVGKHTFYSTDTFHPISVLNTVLVKGHEDPTGGILGLGTGGEIVLVTVMKGEPLIAI